MKDEAHTHATARDEFLTARQLAGILQVSESTVRRLAREGRVPSIRITPRILRFNLKAVRHALDGADRPTRRREPEAAKDDSQLSFGDLLS